MNITYSLGPSSETEVIFYPDWNYSKGDDMSKSTWRTRNGRLFSYKWYTYNKIKFDTSWIINSDAAIVNSRQMAGNNNNKSSFSGVFARLHEA